MSVHIVVANSLHYGSDGFRVLVSGGCRGSIRQAGRLVALV